MGRPKTYDRDEIARKAMDLFWLHGFHGTSTQDLVDHMQVNRYSLYAEFGSKQGLYEAALSLYEQEVVTQHFGALEAPGAGLPEVRRVLDFFASVARQPGTERGCFLCNAATEVAPHDPASQGFVEAYVARIRDSLRHALDGAKGRGELRDGVDTADEARLLTATLLGFFVMLRAQIEPEGLRGAARSALRHLDELRA